MLANATAPANWDSGRGRYRGAQSERFRGARSLPMADRRAPRAGYAPGIAPSCVSNSSWSKMVWWSTIFPASTLK